VTTTQEDTMTENPTRTWPARFRPRVTVEALRWEPGDLEKAGEMIGWLMAAGVDFNHPDGMGDTTTLAVRTPNGDKKVARPGDWIVRGLAGFHPWPAETFDDNYEPPADPLGWVVLTNDVDAAVEGLPKWQPDWDGAVHTGKAQADAELAACADQGYECALGEVRVAES
jgi:hypothetical protein